MTAAATFTFPVSQYSVETGLVSDTLSKLNEGESISYSDLSKAVGLNILKYRNVLNSARKKLKNEQKVFKAINGFGLQRLDNEQIAASGPETVKRIGKAARRGLKIVSCADYDRLSPQGKIRHTVGASILSLMNHAGSEKAIKKIGTTAAPGQRSLPIKDSAESIANLF